MRSSYHRQEELISRPTTLSTNKRASRLPITEFAPNILVENKKCICEQLSRV